MKKYKLGDEWSSDFDYDGMLEMSMKTTVDWKISDLKKLSQSFESVNYHSLNENLYNAILEIENGNKELAKEFIDEFHNDIIKANNEEYDGNEYEENVQLILSLSYPVISEMCRRNGLLLDEAYYLSDGGTDKYYPSIMTLKDDKDNIIEIVLGYYNYDENDIAHIGINVQEKEANIQSDYWEVDDSEKIIGKFKKGGELNDVNYHMIINQSVQLKHHAEELKEALKKKPRIDAWVVAKAERAVTDLSDITHYLDGLNQIEQKKQGGRVKVSATFKDKVQAISKKLKGTKVAPKYQSEYGKTYDKEESIEAARKIAGKMIQKEKNK